MGLCSSCGKTRCDLSVTSSPEDSINASYAVTVLMAGLGPDHGITAPEEVEAAEWGLSSLRPTELSDPSAPTAHPVCDFGHAAQCPCDDVENVSTDGKY